MEIVQYDLFDTQTKIGGKKRKPTKKVEFSKEPLEKKIERAIKLLRAAACAANGPIEICFSGGKDSEVILELAKMAGVKYRAIYKNTTIDPPGTIVHCQSKNVEIIRKKSFAQVIQSKGYPTLYRRFCCSELKEYKMLDYAVQGIRKCESTNRDKRYKEPMICRLYGNKEQHVNVFLPILWWTDKDVAEFIQQRGIKCHPIYYDANGNFNPRCRLGCMACPQKKDHGLHDFKSNPKLVKFWLRNGEIWWNTHKLRKTKRKYQNHYELFVKNLFFKDYESFRLAIDNVFGKIDCKQFIEEYFNITI